MLDPRIREDDEGDKNGISGDKTPRRCEWGNRFMS